jgi:homoserine/homoserine lactone efflux protein
LSPAASRAGVAYLVWLGLKQWRASFKAAGKSAPVPVINGNSRAAFLRGFLVATLNPKTLLFHAAFLPQFIDPATAALDQLLLLGLTFLAIAAVLDSSYALLASRAARLLRNPGLAGWTDRITATLMIGAGLGLALARRQ